MNIFNIDCDSRNGEHAKERISPLTFLVGHRSALMSKPSTGEDMFKRLSLAAALLLSFAGAESALAFHKPHGTGASQSMPSSCAKHGGHGHRCRGWHRNGSKHYHHHHDRRGHHGMVFG
jgi:hypothetical protein